MVKLFENNWIYRGSDGKFVNESGVAIDNPLELIPTDIEDTDLAISKDATPPFTDKPHQDAKETEESSSTTKNESFNTTEQPSGSSTNDSSAMVSKDAAGHRKSIINIQQTVIYC